MRLIVSSNCVTASLALAMEALVPQSEVVAFSYHDLTEARREHLVSLVRGADVWIAGGLPEFRDDIMRAVDWPTVQLVTIPDMVFDAFHPDLVYGWLADGLPLQTLAGPYNSAIALWAMRHNLTAAETVRLFTPEIFDRLGYTRRWQPSIERLNIDLGVHGFDYREYILPLRREGVFMHSTNHPTIAAIAQLGRMIARRLGVDEEVLAEPVERTLVDVLKQVSPVWPVYPSIANSLGVAGSFTWKAASGHSVRLDDYVAKSLEMFDSLGRPEFGCWELDELPYDVVLGSALAGAIR